MIIAHVTFSVAAEKRQEALDVLVSEIAGVRAMHGCLAFVPFVDPSDEISLGVLHEWETAADFAAYGSSSGFAEVGKALRPMMTGAPISRRFDATLLETVN